MEENSKRPDSEGETAFIEQRITEELKALADEGYRDFTARLIPNIDKERIIGVRNPTVRAYAKELFKRTEETEAYLSILPHPYYELNNLHGFLIEKIKDYNRVVALLNEFLPYVDNWSTCDIITPKVFEKHTNELYAQITEWLSSPHVYAVRFGIEMLMCFYLGDKFKLSQALTVAAVDNKNEYYIKMMQAWYFATALAKQYDLVLPIIEAKQMEPWVHNKSIQKAIESNRITPEQKAYLRGLKV